MLVKHKMTHPVHAIRPETTVREAAEHMKVFNLGVLPVCEQDHVIGILTDRDHFGGRSCDPRESPHCL